MIQNNLLVILLNLDMLYLNVLLILKVLNFNLQAIRHKLHTAVEPMHYFPYNKRKIQILKNCHHTFKQ